MLHTIKNKFVLQTIYLVILISIFSCFKKEKSPELKEIINNTKLSDEEALYKIARITFGESLKNFKSEKNSDGKQDVEIEYGGNRAYTFYTKENYKERIQFDTVRYILLYFQSAKLRKINSLRVSLVKPYYVTETDVKKELTEEFEVFRVKISLDEMEKVSNWENSNLMKDKKSINNAQIIELFNQVRLQWKIELNELNRIELK